MLISTLVQEPHPQPSFGQPTSDQDAATGLSNQSLATLPDLLSGLRVCDAQDLPAVRADLNISDGQASLVGSANDQQMCTDEEVEEVRFRSHTQDEWGQKVSWTAEDKKTILRYMVKHRILTKGSARTHMDRLVDELVGCSWLPAPFRLQLRVKLEKTLHYYYRERLPGCGALVKHKRTGRNAYRYAPYTSEWLLLGWEGEVDQFTVGAITTGLDNLTFK